MAVNLQPLTVAAQRDKLWAVYPWPCIGRFKFALLSMHRLPQYGRIIEKLKTGGRFLDVGCAVGQDLRYLVLNGCPSNNMFGIEKMQGFVDLGYGLWRDRDTLQAKFIVADLLDRSNEEARALLGTVDIANVGMVLHVWDLEGQIKACERVVEFMNRQEGALIVGCSVGHAEPGTTRGPEGTDIHTHNVASFKEMWVEVGRRTGSCWKVDAQMMHAGGLNGENVNWNPRQTTRLSWEAERL